MRLKERRNEALTPLALSAPAPTVMALAAAIIIACVIIINVIVITPPGAA